MTRGREATGLVLMDNIYQSVLFTGSKQSMVFVDDPS